MTRDEFRGLTSQGLVLLDGATGSNLMKAGMPRGVCAEQWNLEHPDVILRLQRAYAASAPSNSTLAALTYRKKVQFYFSEEEREHIRRIWFSTGGTGCTDTALAAAALQRLTTEFEESGAATANIYDLAEGDRTFARYWSELCWYGADSEPRRALEQLIELENDPMMYALSKNWNTAGAQEEA